MSIRFSVSPDPLVSIVMVTHGGWGTTRRALDAIVEKTEPPFEVVIVDNASPDETPQRLRDEVGTATLLFNDENVGFGPACNQGAAAARGELICFLNSDAIVEEDWLPPLLSALEQPRVGAVVPMFLNEDGTIQEAGSVVDSVGWAAALGEDEDPKGPEYRFPRMVDYGSAACLLIQKSRFLEIGGFDDAFAPGYFEDVDVCFKLRELGLKTVYEPRARVVHIRHGSSNSVKATEQMVRNRALFYSRWAEQLIQRPRLLEIARMPRRLVAARDAEALDRILVIDDRVPFHDRGSGDPRVFRLLTELVELWPDGRTTLIARDERDAARYAEPLLDRGIEVVYPPINWDVWFEQRRYHYSVVIVGRGQNWGRFDELIRKTQPQALRVFDTEALTFRRLERQAGIVESTAEQARLTAEGVHARALEIRALQEADVVFSVSPEEQEVIEQVAPGRYAPLLPGWVEAAADPPGFGDRRDLIFFGGFLAGPGSPNEDSVLYIVREVMPAFWELEPDAVLHVVGADVTQAVKALQSESVNVVGFVQDPTEWLDRARVHVCPARFGAGVKLKLLDTIAAGLPLVTNAIGGEGLYLDELAKSVLAEEPSELARLVHRLYTDEELWTHVQEGLLAVARTRFSHAEFKRTLVAALSHVGIAPPRDLATFA